MAFTIGLLIGYLLYVCAYDGVIPYFTKNPRDEKDTRIRLLIGLAFALGIIGFFWLNI